MSQRTYFMKKRMMANQHGLSTKPSTPRVQGFDGHLKQALEADRPEIKNYHIRSALQLRVVSEASVYTDQSRQE
jgi:hypothetical protein